MEEKINMGLAAVGGHCQHIEEEDDDESGVGGDEWGIFPFFFFFSLIVNSIWKKCEYIIFVISNLIKID